MGHVKKSAGYLRTFFLALSVWLVAAALLNGLVDPFAAYQLLGINRIDDYKKTRNSRIFKAEMVSHHPYNTLILGTSRAYAFDAQSPCWGPGEVYNAGLSGANVLETFHVFRHALKHADVRRVFFCSGPTSFSSQKRYPDEFTLSRFDPERNEIAHHADNLISLRTTMISLKVLGDFAIDNRAQYAHLGNINEFAKSRRHKTRALFNKQLAHDIRALSVSPYTQERFDLLRQMIEDCRIRDIELIVVIPPFHALHMEAMRAVGRWETFESWKRDVVALVAEKPANRTVVWDFSGYNQYTTETVPQNEDRNAMQWYWESSHFKRTLGDKVLQRVFLDENPNAPTFGVRLTPENIDRHLARIRTERKLWLPGHEQDVELVRDTARRVLKHHDRVATRETSTH